MSELDLRGVWIPLITPFDERDEVDVAAIERLCREYLAAGAVGIVALGTTGEAAALDAAEKQVVVDACSRVCVDAHAPLIVGTGSYNTKQTIAATQALANVPACVGALVVTPYYVRPSEEGIVAHFKAVAAASPVPLVLYNIPARTGRAISASAMLELAAVPNIAGVKHAYASLDADTLHLLANAPAQFQVLGGEDTLLFPLMCMGSVGTICASAHLLTERFVAMIECGLNGKTEDGRAHAEALLPVVQAIFAEPNPALLKAALHAQGRIATPNLRLPMTNASSGALDRLLSAVERASH
ncbi:MAG TPA: 4-hydroxy-tetrahydrodipicolinate synthase [Acidimicrobiia bacterium]|nr:4-hydroxy-tetrahydrodipicolinate synthase [Acidimicrobiia bacterium]